MDTTFKINSNQSVTYTGTAGQTSAVSTTTTKVRIYTTTDALFLIGSNPTATATNSTPTTAGIPEFWDIDPGQKISFLQQTVGGTAYVTEVSKT